MFLRIAVRQVQDALPGWGVIGTITASFVCAENQGIVTSESSGSHGGHTAIARNDLLPR